MPEVRLIDGALLEQRIDSAINKANDCFDFALAARMLAFKNIVKSQPTIEAEQVRHANAIYIPNSKGYPSCSCCHEEMPFFLNFCPCCGAKIDGGADDA